MHIPTICWSDGFQSFEESLVEYLKRVIVASQRDIVRHCLRAAGNGEVGHVRRVVRGHFSRLRREEHWPGKRLAMLTAVLPDFPPLRDWEREDLIIWRRPWVVRRCSTTADIWAVDDLGKTIDLSHVPSERALHQVAEFISLKAIARFPKKIRFLTSPIVSICAQNFSADAHEVDYARFCELLHAGGSISNKDVSGRDGFEYARLQLFSVLGSFAAFGYLRETVGFDFSTSTPVIRSRWAQLDYSEGGRRCTRVYAANGSRTAIDSVLTATAEYDEVEFY